jgi:hypothetical protein
MQQNYGENRLRRLQRIRGKIMFNKKAKAKKLNNLQLIGAFFVDSGQAMIGDPAYLSKWDNCDDEDFDNYKDSEGKYNWLGAAHATLTNQFGTLGEYDSVVFSTGNGDGLYPVYAQIEEYDEWGPRVWAVVIDMSRDGRYVKDKNL